MAIEDWLGPNEADIIAKVHADRSRDSILEEKKALEGDA